MQSTRWKPWPDWHWWTTFFLYILNQTSECEWTNPCLRLLNLVEWKEHDLLDQVNTENSWNQNKCNTHQMTSNELIMTWTTLTWWVNFDNPSTLASSPCGAGKTIIDGIKGVLVFLWTFSTWSLPKPSGASSTSTSTSSWMPLFFCSLWTQFG